MVSCEGLCSVCTKVCLWRNPFACAYTCGTSVCNLNISVDVLWQSPSFGVRVLWHSPSLGVRVLWHHPGFGVLAGVSVLWHSPSPGVLAGVIVLWHSLSQSEMDDVICTWLFTALFSECICNPIGTDPNGGECDRVTGQCPCLPNVVGQDCGQCAPAHWDLSSGQGCQGCNCDPTGSLSLDCNQVRSFGLEVLVSGCFVASYYYLFWVQDCISMVVWYLVPFWNQIK